MNIYRKLQEWGLDIRRYDAYPDQMSVSFECYDNEIDEKLEKICGFVIGQIYHLSISPIRNYSANTTGFKKTEKSIVQLVFRIDENEKG